MVQLDKKKLKKTGINVEEIVIDLILQDLRHNQLIMGLFKTELNVDSHHLQIIDSVAQLMEIPKDEITDQFSKVYIGYMWDAPNYEITDLGEKLKPLARKCYHDLRSCIRIEDRAKKAY